LIHFRKSLEEEEIYFYYYSIVRKYKH